jgi:hypothetical protein
MGGLSSVIKLACDGMRDNRLLWALIAVFALFPIFTHFADLPFWNDVAMRIMLLGMAAMGPESGAGLWRHGVLWACCFCRHWCLLCGD